MNFRDKIVTITTKKDKAISRAGVEGAIEKGGYGVTSFKELPVGAEQESRKQSGS